MEAILMGSNLEEYCGHPPIVNSYCDVVIVIQIRKLGD